MKQWRAGELVGFFNVKTRVELRFVSGRRWRLTIGPTALEFEGTDEQALARFDRVAVLDLRSRRRERELPGFEESA